ncbi:cytochrome P450 [Amycolatopsis acidicola]|uniref:Cytochrome P450 n=1 Tax=Amycolatopsis acidicola TaxID=2596893 RepID=A0A5N0VEC5_9PSEU|nr:cytochrome P450 [Amycolatopsis acidicola]KAA9163978.1 cytochrome P450 [Amycolatopsis acidicola]
MNPENVTVFSEHYWDNETTVLSALREQAAVHQARLADGIRVWVIVRYADAQAALTDQRLSKDAGRLGAVMRQQRAALGGETALSTMFNPHMLFADDPAHARLRSLVASQFTRRRVETLRPRVERISNELLDALPAGRPVDLLEHYAFPLPLTVICELLGVPATDRRPFRGWTAALMKDDPDVTVPASRAMERYFTDLIRAKRQNPGDDLLSALAASDGNGDQLTFAELIGTVFLLFVAGHETSTNMIGNLARALLQTPGQWCRLTSDPDLIPAAVEELLRYDSPVGFATHRVTTEPVIYGGVEIPAGEIVMVSLLSANRDPDQFSRPDQLNMTRDARSHLSFGHGIHYCLGAPLGRLEAEVSLSHLTSRFPRARLVTEFGAPRRQQSAIMNGHRALWVQLSES